MITSAIKAIVGLQALKNGNLLMTIKRDVYFKTPEFASRYKNPDDEMSERGRLHVCLVTGEEFGKGTEDVIEACSVENMTRSIECNVKYDDFFNTIRGLLKRIEWKGLLPEDFDSMNNAELWMASNGYQEESEPQFFILNQGMNQLLIDAIPEEHYDMFSPVMAEWKV